MMTILQLKAMVDKAIELKGNDAEVYITCYDSIAISGGTGGMRLDIDPTNVDESSPELLAALPK